MFTQMTTIIPNPNSISINKKIETAEYHKIIL